jgi:RNA polymerase sigma-70 factor (ECF subfamily)
MKPAMHHASSAALPGWQSMGAVTWPLAGAAADAPPVCPPAANGAAGNVAGTGFGGAAKDDADVSVRRGEVIGEVRSADPDGALVAAAIAGDRDAFEALVRRHQTRIVNYAMAIVKYPADAEDVAQETFIRAYRSLTRFRGDSSFKTWLYTIATNAARTGLERRVRRNRLEDESLDDEAAPLAAGDVPAGGADAETTLVQRESIDRALAALPPDLRIAVVLRDVEGLDYKEIAAATGAPIGTVESRIFRARRRLRALLQPLIGRSS